MPNRRSANYYRHPRQFYAGFIKHPMRHRPRCGLVHMDALIAGLRFPLHSFVVEFLRRLSVLPAQFVPSTYRILNGFIVQCHDLGIAPNVDLFLHCYGVQPYWTTGYLRLVARPGRSLFTDNPTPPPPPEKWEERFLFVHVGSPLPFLDRWNTYPAQDVSPKVDAAILCQYERFRLAGPKNLRSFLTPAKMLAVGIGTILFNLGCSVYLSILCLSFFIPLFSAGVIPSTPPKRPAPTPSPTEIVNKGKEKVIQPGSFSGRESGPVNKRPRTESGGELVPIDQVIDLTDPSVERMHAVPSPPRLLGNRGGSAPDNFPIPDQLTVEFSAMGPRAECRTLFGQTASSMWCNTSLKAGEGFTNLTHWSDLVEAGHAETLKAGTYYHRAFLAAEREMTLLHQELDESQTLLAAARKMAADLQDRANKGDKAREELAELEQRLQRRDREIRDLRAKVKAAEAAGLKIEKAKGENPPAPSNADASKITKKAVIDFQRGKGLNIAPENTAREFLGKHLGEFLEKSKDPLHDGLKLLDETPSGTAFANALAKDTLVKCQDMLVDRNLEVIKESFDEPFDPKEEGFDPLFCRAYQRVMEKRQKAKDSADPSNSKSDATPNKDPPLA
ncbi:unnamed protein product [Cuscuta epithymum]|uniref:Transposase (putative) gypsy type domain-containing protein n=1 Tax=Cuscuta epithymum TaxID=186058 RepID=A0AAV0ESI3_9ASTE|nr:unnamed protein product [Cuscuta epithymum]CAH9126196.1 unnamed protein product [Cuscuta epithymum]